MEGRRLFLLHRPPTRSMGWHLMSRARFIVVMLEHFTRFSDPEMP